MLTINNAEINYPGVNFLFNLSLHPGEKVAIIGASGSGKTTLFYSISGLVKLKSGSIEYDNDPINRLQPSERPVSILFQDYNLFPHMTNFENVAIGISSNLDLSQEQRHTVKKAFEVVDLADYINAYPDSLSGGQKQRVALARAFVRKRPILILDEPLTGLDPWLRKLIIDLIDNLHKQQNFTLLLSTHHLQDTANLCDKTAFIYQGHIKYFGKTDEILKANYPELNHYLGLV